MGEGMVAPLGVGLIVRLLNWLTPTAATAATAAVALGLMTNAWLYSEEKMRNAKYNGTGDQEYLSKFTVSGLWTLCHTNPGGTDQHCFYIDYFPKEDYSPDVNDSTMAIPYAVIRSAPFYLVASFFLLLGEITCCMGHFGARRRFLTFVAGVTFIVSGLFLLAGFVMYVSVFKAEIGSKLRPKSSFQDALFSYTYGYSFLSVVSGFLLSEVAGVSAIFLFMYWHRYRLTQQNRHHRFALALVQPPLNVSTRPTGRLPPPPPPLPPQFLRPAGVAPESCDHHHPASTTYSHQHPHHPQLHPLEDPKPNLDNHPPCCLCSSRNPVTAPSQESYVETYTATALNRRDGSAPEPQWPLSICQVRNMSHVSPPLPPLPPTGSCPVHFPIRSVSMETAANATLPRAPKLFLRTYSTQDTSRCSDREVCHHCHQVVPPRSELPDNQAAGNHQPLRRDQTTSTVPSYPECQEHQARTSAREAVKCDKGVSATLPVMEVHHLIPRDNTTHTMCTMVDLGSRESVLMVDTATTTEDTNKPCQEMRGNSQLCRAYSQNSLRKITPV